MRYSEITESPQWVEPTQFDLDDLTSNRKFAAEKLKKTSEIIEDTADYKMVRTGDGHNGWIFLYNVKRRTADYAIRYATRSWNWLPKTVTQCVLWHNPNSLYVKDATTRMFFGYLLQHYPAIMSDLQQTDAGHHFWQRRMAEAVNKNYKVGVVDMATHNVSWYDKNTDYEEWITGQDTFGKEVKYQNKRYIIAT